MKDEIVAPGIELLESMRSVGYSLEAAIADLVDNSVAANATSIEVDLEPVNADYIAILDNGHGMSPTQAVEALRLAGSVGERSANDLGRFGLGLKTASLSQARRLTVLTRREGITTGLQWDIDHIKQTGSWSLQHLTDHDMTNVPWWMQFDANDSGTLVVLRRLDLLLGDAKDAGSHLVARVEPLRSSLSLVFHRYLHRKTGGVTVTVNGIDLKPLDPFLETNVKTQESPTQTILIGGEKVEVTAFTLPHPGNLTAAERQRPDLGEGMRDNQGFYVYRNRRLISHGHWFGLARVTELSKQTRVRVDIPNTLDHLWQLDIKKSRAEPPASFKAELRRLIDSVIERGRRVHTYRGRAVKSSGTTHLWDKVEDRAGIRYDVNLENPLVLSTLSSLETASAAAVTRLLQALSAGFPAYDLYAEMARNTGVVTISLESDGIEDALRQIRDNGTLGNDRDAIAAALAHAEPFDQRADLREMIDRIWEEGVNGAQ